MKKRKLFLCALAALTTALTLFGCAGNSSAFGASVFGSSVFGSSSPSAKNCKLSGIFFSFIFVLLCSLAFFSNDCAINVFTLTAFNVFADVY